MAECNWSEVSSLSLTGLTRETHNGEREKSSGQTQLFNIRTKEAMDRTSAQPQVKLSFFINISFKNPPLGLTVARN
jgi:hypothetical protein